MILAVKLKNEITKLAKAQGLDLTFKLKNIVINGEKRGCTGFITDNLSKRVIYVNTEGVNDKSLYRSARHEKDFTGGLNLFARDEELPQRVINHFKSSDAFFNSFQ